MFSTVRGKECGSTTKSKKDIGVSAKEKEEKNLQQRTNYFAHQLRPIFSSVNQRKKVGIHPIMGWKSVQPRLRTIWCIY